MRLIDLHIAGRSIRLQAQVAERWWDRARGLLGRPALPVGEGLLLSPCASVHGMGMVRSLDLVFLDGSWTIVKLSRLRPLGVAWDRHAVRVLEMRAGEIQRLGLQCGQRLSPASR